MAQDPWAEFRVKTAPVGPSRRPDEIIAPADPYKQAGEARANEDQALQRAQFGLAVQSADRADKAAMRAEVASSRMSVSDSDAIRRKVAAFGKLLRSATQFQDDFSNVGAGIENFAQSYSPIEIGTPGQRDWWSEFKSADNLIRNELFGASLSGGEKSAYGETTVQPGMNPKEVLININRRAEEARGEMSRIVNSLYAAGYNKEQIDAALGEYKPLITGEKPLPLRQPVNENNNGDQEGLVGGVSDEGPRRPGEISTDPNGGGTPQLDPRMYNPEGMQGIFDLAEQGVTLGLSDEAAGAGSYLGAILTGQDASKAYSTTRDQARENLRRARVAHPVVGTLAEFLGGGAAARIGTAASSVGTMARQGSALGGVGGFGYGQGDTSLASAAGGAAIGGALGGALGGVGNLMQARSARNALQPEQMAVVEAGQRQNIPIRQPDVRPELRNKLAQIETTGAGGPVIQQARQADAAAMEMRLSDIGGEGTAAADPYALGTKVQQAGKDYIARTKAQADRLYIKANDEAGGATVQPTEALGALDAQIADLRATGENANAAAIKYLEDIRADLSTEGGVSIDAIRNIRTNMRGQISERGLTGTDTDRRVMAAIEGANVDMARDLPPEAAKAFRAADTFYKDRQTFIKNTLQTVLGTRANPLSPETAAARLVSMTKGKGNFDKFSSMWRELPEEDRADTAATIAEALGKKDNGGFAVSALLKSLDPQKGINPRTARLVFGEDGARALEDLRLIASSKEATQRALNNSRTGTAVNATGDSLRTMMWGLFGFTQGGPAGAAGGAVARNFLSSLSEKRAARMLMNPDFTKLLRNAPNTNDPATINRYLSRVAGVLGANDNEAFTRAIANAVSRSPGRAAAQDETNSGGKPPQ